jgi:hypothetical protein
VTEITSVDKKRQGLMSARIQFSTLHDRIVRGPSPSLPSLECCNALTLCDSSTHLGAASCYV